MKPKVTIEYKALLIIYCSLSRPVLATEPYLALPEIKQANTNDHQVASGSCLIHFNLDGADRNLRRNVIIRLTNDLSEAGQSKTKSQNGIMVGIDYITFSRFYTYYNAPCQLTTESRAHLAHLITSTSNGGQRNGSIVISENVETNSWVVGPSSQATNSLSAFVNVFGTGEIADCAVSFDAIPSVQPSDLPKLDAYIYRVIEKYHVPIADASRIDRTFYILFSRDCDGKKVFNTRGCNTYYLLKQHHGVAISVRSLSCQT